MTQSETSPLLPPSNASGAESSNYYFLRKESRGNGPVQENLPQGSTPEEFAPRVIGSPMVVCYYTFRKSCVLCLCLCIDKCQKRISVCVLIYSLFLSYVCFFFHHHVT